MWEISGVVELDQYCETNQDSDYFNLAPRQD